MKNLENLNLFFCFTLSYHQIQYSDEVFRKTSEEAEHTITCRTPKLYFEI